MQDSIHAYRIARLCSVACSVAHSACSALRTRYALRYAYRAHTGSRERSYTSYTPWVFTLHNRCLDRVGSLRNPTRTCLDPALPTRRRPFFRVGPRACWCAYVDCGRTLCPHGGQGILVSVFVRLLPKVCSRHAHPLRDSRAPLYAQGCNVHPYFDAPWVRPATSCAYPTCCWSSSCGHSSRPSG